MMVFQILVRYLFTLVQTFLLLLYKSESTDEHDSEVKQDASQSSMDDDEIAALLAETQGSPVEVADQTTGDD